MWLSPASVRRPLHACTGSVLHSGPLPSNLQTGLPVATPRRLHQGLCRCCLWSGGLGRWGTGPHPCVAFGSRGSWGTVVGGPRPPTPNAALCFLLLLLCLRAHPFSHSFR